MEYDIVVYIGRFQGFTDNGHRKVLNIAKKHGRHVVMALGSVNQPRSKKNPFSFYERCEMIRLATKYDPQILFRPIRDLKTDEDWVIEVKHRIAEACEMVGVNYDKAKIALIGMNKDESSYYLRYFPFWNYIEFPKPDEVVSATDVRNILFGNPSKLDTLSMYVDPSIVEYMKNFIHTDYYEKISNQK